jgi:hypothetical protein
VAEKLVLQERLGDGGAIDGEEGPGSPAAQVMQSPSEQLLPGTGFPQEEHRRLGEGYFLQLGEGLVQRGAASQDRGESQLGREPLAQKGVLPRQMAMLQGPLQQSQKVIRVHRLLQEIVGPVFHGSHRIGHGAERGHENDRESWLGPPGGAQDLETVRSGKLEIREHQEKFLPLQPGERLLAVRAGQNRIAFLLQGPAEHVPEPLLVLHQEDPPGGIARRCHRPWVRMAHSGFFSRKVARSLRAVSSWRVVC